MRRIGECRDQWQATDAADTPRKATPMIDRDAAQKVLYDRFRLLFASVALEYVERVPKDESFSVAAEEFASIETDRVLAALGYDEQPDPRIAKLSKHEFVSRYASKSNVTEAQLAEMGLHAEPCDCGDETCLGWQMVSQELATLEEVEAIAVGYRTKLEAATRIASEYWMDRPQPYDPSTHPPGYYMERICIALNIGKKDE